jgi:hypothetical protein
MLSLAQKLSALFHKPRDTKMDFDTWSAIVTCYLYQPVDHVLFYFMSAAKVSPDPQTLVLDRLIVVWMWLNKDPDPPEHEFLILLTQDSQDGTKRIFILNRTALQVATKQSNTTKADDSKHPTTSNYQQLEKKG